IGMGIRAFGPVSGAGQTWQFFAGGRGGGRGRSDRPHERPPPRGSGIAASGDRARRSRTRGELGGGRDPRRAVRIARRGTVLRALPAFPCAVRRAGGPPARSHRHRRRLPAVRRPPSRPRRRSRRRPAGGARLASRARSPRTRASRCPGKTGRFAAGRPKEGAVFKRWRPAEGLGALRAIAATLSDALALATPSDQWAGLRPATADGLPIIGFSARSVIAATGHYRNGILLAPATAEAVVDLVAGRPRQDLRDFDPGRFAPDD